MAAPVAPPTMAPTAAPRPPPNAPPKIAPAAPPRIAPPSGSCAAAFCAGAATAMVMDSMATTPNARFIFAPSIKLDSISLHPDKAEQRRGHLPADSSGSQDDDQWRLMQTATHRYSRTSPLASGQPVRLLSWHLAWRSRAPRR